MAGAPFLMKREAQSDTAIGINIAGLCAEINGRGLVMLAQLHNPHKRKGCETPCWTVRLAQITLNQEDSPNHPLGEATNALIDSGVSSIYNHSCRQQVDPRDEGLGESKSGQQHQGV
jgi:hypothetical protein